jgi:cytochrome P450
LSYDAIKAIPYLDAIINESLRLKPPVPSQILRRTPPQGLWVDELFIPGDVHVGVPTYSVQRDPRYWDRPDEFVPERWMGKDKKDKIAQDAFLPFSIGTSPQSTKDDPHHSCVIDNPPLFLHGLLTYINTVTGSYSCIGKSTALMELRSVLAGIAMKFDIAFAPGETGEVFDTKGKDYFVYQLPELRLVFTPRKHMEGR